MTRIDLLGGKYTVQHDNGVNFKALRYGEEWRDLTGDGLVLALVQRIRELEECLLDAKEWVAMHESNIIDNILSKDHIFK